MVCLLGSSTHTHSMFIFAHVDLTFNNDNGSLHVFTEFCRLLVMRRCFLVYEHVCVLFVCLNLCQT